MNANVTIEHSLLSDDMCLPIATLQYAQLIHNIKWMQEFADMNGVKLAPHGKTTMSPFIFKEQLKHGAWAICVATAQQAITAYEAGAKRIILANQLIGNGNMNIIASLDKTVEFYCLVDSIENADALNTYFKHCKQTINVLLELGVANGRTGCRSETEATILARHVKNLSNVKLCGVEFYEGLINGTKAICEIDSLINRAIQLVKTICTSHGFDQDNVLLSGAGSAWYDVVTDKFNIVTASIPNLIPIIRPGCYVTHDGHLYAKAQQKLRARKRIDKYPKGELISCLEIWAHVQSVPESGLAIIAMGKRNVAFDAGLPMPKKHYRAGQQLSTSPAQTWEVTSIMDHHAFLKIPTNASILPGDVIVFSTSHPCLTFDKWREFLLITDDGRILQSIPIVL